VTSSVSRGVYLDEPWLSIGWDADHLCIYAEWKGFASSAQFRASTMQILKAIQARHARRLVSDNRRLELVTSENQLWIRDTWTPAAVAAGLRRIAVVLAPRGLGRFASEQILFEIRRTSFVTRTFDNVAEATDWVASDEK
jgi:hypothetical protein